MADSYAKINGIKICYEIIGEGYPFLLLHGFGQHKGFWFAQIGALSKRFKVITMDNRGSGNSDHPVDPYTMETLAADVNGLLDFLKIDKVHLLGWATGGMIAQYFVLNYPNRVNKVVLLGTLTQLPLSKSGLEMFKNSQLSFHEAKIKDPDNAFYSKMKQRFSRGFFKQLVQEPNKKFFGIFSTEDLREQVFKDTSQPNDIENRISAIAGISTLKYLSQIKHETLILAAETDRITPKSTSIEINGLMSNSILKIFEGAHYFPLERAPEVNDAIVEFLKD